MSKKTTTKKQVKSKSSSKPSVKYDDWMMERLKKNKKEAFEKAYEFGEKKIPLGVFYKEEKPSSEEGYSQISETPLVDQDVKLELDGLTNLFKKYT